MCFEPFSFGGIAVQISWLKGLVNMGREKRFFPRQRLFPACLAMFSFSMIGKFIPLTPVIFALPLFCRPWYSRCSCSFFWAVPWLWCAGSRASRTSCVWVSREVMPWLVWFLRSWAVWLCVVFTAGVFKCSEHSGLLRRGFLGGVICYCATGLSAFSLIQHVLGHAT